MEDLFLKRTLFKPEHEEFRQTVRQFIRENITPHYEEWEKDGIVPRELWNEVGELGWLCPTASSDYGGTEGDLLYNLVINEEISRARASGFFVSLHNEIVYPYLESFGSKEQKELYIPRAISGECVLALAMTEPSVGSDLARLSTTATEDGDSYILNGSKTFISNGQLADLFIVAARTEASPEAPHKGITLFLVEAKTAGFSKGKKLSKIGLKAQDTSEIFFDNCRISKKNLLGVKNRGFYHMMENLSFERLSLAAGGVAAMEGAFELTKSYIQEREAFKQSLSKFQHIRFQMSEVATKIQLSRVFMDELYERLLKDPKADLLREVSMAKYWITETQFEVMHKMLQLYGGYGYMTEYPISGYFVDARVQSIYGGTSEIMKEIIAKSYDF